jgi:probable F420-dependent oxidoreductase
MKIGLFGIGSGPCADPDVARAVAQAAEAAGFESLWTGEHVVLPDPQAPPSPAPPDFPMLHPSTVLAYLAGVTENVKLGTGIILLPQRNPVVLAKELASLDVVSGGRLLFGLGVGYLEAEFRALGVPFEGRGSRADEYLDAMKTLWADEHPSFAGRFTSFSGIQARPRPLQQPHPPIIVGGGSPAAYRRATSRANGWYGFALDFDGTEAALAGLRDAAKQVDRPDALGEIEISVTPTLKVDRDAIRRFEDMGVQRVVSLMRGRDRDSLLSFVEGLAEEAAAASISR